MVSKSHGLWQICERTPIVVASFDLFDTLITRRIASQEGLYRSLGRRLAQKNLLPLPSEQFAYERGKAVPRLKRIKGTGDPTLEEIYREMSFLRAWPEDLQRTLVAEELRLELELIVPWGPGLSVLQEARSLGLQVVYVSDTFLPGAFLWSRLRELQISEPGDLLFTSSDANATKIDGGLLPFVRDCLKTNQIVHVGNDAIADVQRAEDAGLQRLHLRSGNLNHFESLHECHSTGSGGLAGAYAGATRLARGEMLSRDPSDGGNLVSAIAPFVVDFARWTIQTAQALKLDRLYFLAREGQTLHLATRMLLERFNLPIETRYLLTSRHALNLAALRSNTPRERAWVLTHSRYDTPASLVARLGLSPTDFTRLGGSDIDFSELDWHAADATATLMGALDSDHVSRLLLQAAEERRRAVLPYLRKVGFLDDLRVGVVDSAGVGSQLRALEQLRGTGCSPIIGMMVKRSAPERGLGTRDLEGLPEIRAYLYDEHARLGFQAIPGFLILLEVLLAATHGRVSNYRLDRDGETVCELDDPPTPEVRRVIERIREGITLTIDNLVLDPTLVDIDGDTRHAVAQALRQLWEEPAPADARLLATIPFESGTSTGAAEPLAQPFSPFGLVNHLTTRRYSISGPHAPWIAGSIAMSPAPTRNTYSTLRRAKRRFSGSRNTGNQ